MPKPSKFDVFPPDIQSGLALKFLARERYKDISQWLNQQHRLNLSPRVLQGIGKPLQDKYAPLLALGMPAAEIVKNRLKIDALGVAQVEQSLREKLTANTCELFAYLNDQEPAQ